ncbi:MAG: precorrin-2 C(20)-methyltransferase [Thermoleophilia bacterium]
MYDTNKSAAGTGTLYGVGVGPGDPGMVTLRAVEVIRTVPTIAFPVKKEGAPSRALETVRDHIPAAATLLPLLMPMTRDRDQLAQAHAAAAAALIAAAAEGKEVAFLSLGDPLFYSTFGYLAAKFPGKVEAVSGVTAMSAAAAALGRPLAERDEATVVVTGVDHEQLKKALQMKGSIIIMKPRALSEASLDLLQEHGAFTRASAIIELGGEAQDTISHLDRTAAAGLPYFAIIWIKQP